MLLWNCSLFLIAANWFVRLIYAQTNHVITVGQLGSFYDPPTLSAALHDTVTFLFLGPFHTVTQSSADNPCLPLPGGFDSGVLGLGTNDTSTTPTPSWTLTITNASEPIYFFCEITHPTSHCGSGMVGVINPPSQQAYLNFKTLAEMVSATPTPSPTLILTGIGAAATGSPSSLMTTISTTGQATVTVTPQGPSSTKAHLGAILGGAVGGFFGVVLVSAAILYWLRRRRPLPVPSSPTVTDDSHFFRYDPGPVARPLRPSEAFVAAKALESSLPMRTLSPDSTTVALVPNRRRSNPPVGADSLVPGVQHELGRQASLQSNLATPTASESTAPGTVNMQALANEVAAVLMRAPSGQTLNSNIGMHADTAEAQYQHAHMGSLGSANGQEPPAYHAGMRSPVTEVSGVKVNHNR